MKTLVKNGKVFDGTGAPWYRADILLDNGLIEAVGIMPGAAAEVVIDARGLAVVPGFIDAHSHTDMFPFPDPDGKIIQGVTTEIAGMCGLSRLPAESSMNRSGLAADLVIMVGQGRIRERVIGSADREPAAEELDRMKDLLREAMELGAAGMSSGLIYPPGCYTKTWELTELCRVVAEYGGVYVSHIRNEADDLIPAVEEAIAIGRESGCKVQISHHKASGKQNHGKVRQTLEMMEKARGDSVDVCCDAYPYTAGSSPTVTLLPNWVQEGGSEDMLGRLRDKDLRRRAREDILNGIPGWENMCMNSGMDGVLVCSAPENTQFEGKNLKEIGEIQGKDPVDALIDLIIDEEGDGWIAHFGACEEDNYYVLQHRLTMVGSDGWAAPCSPDIPMGKPHPRCYGTFPRVLGRYCRDLGLFPPETAIWKMTGFPATRFGLKDRGFLMAGLIADLVIFDPDTIADNLSYQEPWAAPEGVRYVIKNGEIAVEGKRYLHNKQGKAVAVK